MNSGYAVELSRQRSTNTSRISIGYEHRFGSEVLVKSKLIAMGPWLHYFSTSGIQERFTGFQQKLIYACLLTIFALIILNLIIIFSVAYSYNRRADLLKVYLHQSVMNSAYAVELSRQRSTNTNQD